MDRRPNTVQTIGAFAAALTAFGLAGLLIDPTPLLVEPRPDLDWPLGLLGVAVGLWAAYRITSLPYATNRRVGRIALWIMLPLMLSFGLAALGDRVHEAMSFRRGGSMEEATVLVAEKSSSTGRRGRVSYGAGVISPMDEHVVKLPVDRGTFEQIEPNRECATLLIERAPNGAARLLKPLRWKVRCP